MTENETGVTQEGRKREKENKSTSSWYSQFWEDNATIKQEEDAMKKLERPKNPSKSKNCQIV